jgi:hypothetical protein
MPTGVARRGKDIHVEIVVRRGKSYRADAYGTAACFGRAIDLGTAKRVRFKIKKITVLDLEFVLEKSLGTAFRPLYHISITVVGAALLQSELGAGYIYIYIYIFLSTVHDGWGKDRSWRVWLLVNDMSLVARHFVNDMSSYSFPSCARFQTWNGYLSSRVCRDGS